MGEPKVGFSRAFYIDRKTDEVLWQFPLDLSRKEEIDIENFLMIDRLIEPDETRQLSWTGYVVRKMDEEVIVYEYCAFALSEHSLYIGADDASKAYAARESMSSCPEYCYHGAENDFGLPWFVFYCRDDIEFYCYPDDGIDKKIIEELEKRNIRLS